MGSKVEENYKRLREELNERLNNDKRLTEIMDKISKGTATFKDSAEYSQIVADHMGDVISKNIGNIKIPMGKEMVCKELLKENIERVDTVFGKVQVSVDEKMGIHLNPVTPPYPTERVNAIAHSLEDPNADDEKVARRGKSSGNVVAARHDENVKANAAWREKAGFDCYLVRDAGGGCCAWCAALEGRYEYASAPDDIFRRHDNCTCTVTYECGKMRQDVWSKKTWEADPKDVEARKAASEAARPTVKTPAEAQALNEQSKSNITVLSKEQAEAINEQHKAVKFTEAEAKEREAMALGKDDNVNNISLEKQGESDKMKVADSGDVYYNVSADAIERVPKLNIFEKDELNIAHQKASQDLLAEVSKHKELPAGTEFSIVYDENMNRIPNYDYVQGEVGKTPIDTPSVPYHAFHNHGSNETLSFSDLQGFAASSNMRSLTAQGNLGDKFSIIAGDNADREGLSHYLNDSSNEIIMKTELGNITLGNLYSDETKQIVSTFSEEQQNELLNLIKIKTNECLKGAEKYGFRYITKT